MRHGNPIQAITNLTKAIANPATGDWIFLDIDDTLLLTGLSKYHDQPHLAEIDLAAEISRLRQRGIHVVGLTARKQKYADATRAQLTMLGIELDDVIHAQDLKVGNKHHLQKSVAFHNYLTTMAKIGKKPQRIFIIDDLITQLEDIAAHYQWQDIPLFLKHYQRSQFARMPATTDEDFPDSLANYVKVKPLGGGTESVFLIQDKITGKQLVLKYGAHEAAGKMEMLGNVMYQALGVAVPAMRVYNTLPHELAQSLNLRNPYGMFKVCEYIAADATLNEQQRLMQIKTAARTHFATHALLGNIDVVKADNFIINQHGTPYLIDAGANFIFRSKGNLRKENPGIASEVDSLRDKDINPTGADWFAGLSAEDLAAQLQKILNQQQQLEAVVWNVSQELNIDDELRDRFMKNLSDRLDILVTRFITASQTHARVNKQAITRSTSAGILTYTMINGEPHVLLSQRVRHQWWDNFGGKSDDNDENLLTTAQREVAEESGHLLHYTDLELQNSPCHDIVTVTPNRKQQLYRMYISHYDYVDPAKLNDDEHVAHQWVPLKNILAALDAQKLQQFEGKDTVVVTHNQHDIPLFPPLFTILQQAPVRASLNELLQGKELSRKRTLSYDKTFTDATQTGRYRPLLTPIEKRQQIADTLVKKSHLIREFKRKHGKPIVEKRGPLSVNTTLLSQSEIHLKAILGDEYQSENMEENVRTFVRKHFSSLLNKEELIRYCVALIENEKRSGDKNIYFYHACSNSIAFAYDVYTAIYRVLQQDERWSVLRPDSEYFKRFLTINEFIAFYSNNGREDISNNAKNYNDCALSTNVFLFGNHEMETSCTIQYLVNNDVRRPVDLLALFKQLLAPFKVTNSEISRLLSLFDTYQSTQGGTLYQIVMPAEQASSMSYPAVSRGAMYALDGDKCLPSLLKKLREFNDHDIVLRHITRDYIRQLQARVMVPPHLNLTTHAVKLKQLPAEQEAEYQSALAKTADALVHKILSHAGHLNDTQSNAPLLKMLPDILRHNQLAYTTAITDEALARAIVSDNMEIVTTALRKYPELLNKKIMVPREYIGASDRAGYLESDLLTVTELIVRRSNMPLDILINFAEQGWAQSFINTHVKNFSDVKLIVLKIPEQYRMEFILHNRDKYHASESHILSIMQCLGEVDRLIFANKIIEDIRRLHCVTTVAQLLPIDCQLNFIQKYLADDEDLRFVLKHIPVAERLAMAQRHAYVIANVEQLCSVLSHLPAEARLTYASHFADLVDSFTHLQAVVRKLYDSGASEFCRLKQNLIKNSCHLAKLLPHMLRTERLKYASEYLDKIQNGKQLADILECIGTEDRLQIALANLHHCKNVQDYFDIIISLPPKDELAFAKACRHLFLTEADLLRVSNLLSASSEEKRAFMCRPERYPGVMMFDHGMHNKSQSDKNDRSHYDKKTGLK